MVRHLLFRRDDGGGVLYVVVVVVAVALVAFLAYVLLIGEGESLPEKLDDILDGDEEVIPTVTMEFSARRDGTVYDVDLDLDVEDKGFLRYFFSASVEPDFPSGDNTLELVVYEGTLTDRSREELVHRTWHVGDMYDPDGDGNQESTWEVELPALRTDTDPEEGTVHLWAHVYYNNDEVGFKHWSVNPELMEVEEV